MACTHAWVALVAACACAAGCREIDDLLGAEDHEFLAVRIAEEQPEDPAHGVLASLVVFAMRDGLLDLDARHGAVERQGQESTTSFCQAITTAGEDTVGVVVPIVVYPEESEALLHVRLLTPGDAGAAACDGIVRQSISVFVSAPAGAEPPPDAAPPDAAPDASAAPDAVVAADAGLPDGGAP
jgi:triphosphoribosyl-dephospho-CoA synthetase